MRIERSSYRFSARPVIFGVVERHNDTRDEVAFAHVALDGRPNTEAVLGSDWH